MFNRPLLRYLGGKYLLSPWIILHFPLHQIYCEPFAGGASVLLNKAPSPIEIYNDLDGRLNNFFRVLRDGADELLEKLELTPYSRAEYDLALSPSEDPVEDARRLYVLSWQCRGGGYVANGGRGWRYQNKDWAGNDVVRNWHRYSDLRLFADRLLNVQIEQDCAFKVISRYDSPKTLFYLDPTYLHETRSANHRWEYFHEMTKNDHQKLAELLNSIQGMAIISHYPCELYDRLYKDWRCIQKEVRTQGRTTATECLWINPACDRALNSLFSLPLFAGKHEEVI